MQQYRKPVRRPARTLDGVTLAPRVPKKGVGTPSSHSVTTQKTELPSSSQESADVQRREASNVDPHSWLNLNLAAGPPGKKYQMGRQKRRKHSFGWWAIRTGSVTLCLVLISGGFLFAKGYAKFHKVFKGGGTAVALQAHVDPNLLKGEGDGRVNILLLGKGGPGHDGPDLTDTLLVASIDPVNHTAALVSVPRDLWVSAPGGGSSKINAVYANAKYKALAKAPRDAAGAEAAGIQAAEQVMSSVLGMPVHYYTMVDFTAFKEAVDTVGGVTVNVPEELDDATMAWENNWSPVLARAGVQTFGGKQALLYVRSRHGSARGDFDRTERQRLLLTALEQKILSADTYTNPLKLSQLMSAFGDHVTTDIGTGDAGRLLTLFTHIGGNLNSVDLATAPHDFLTTGAYANQSVVLPRAGVGNYGDLQAYIRLTLRDGYLVKENANVTVLNGTTNPAAATQQAAVLKSYGYNVGMVGDAPTHDYAKTTIIDLSGGADPYTKHYLEKRYGVTATTKRPTNLQLPSAQFAIIVGQQ